MAVNDFTAFELAGVGTLDDLFVFLNCRCKKNVRSALKAHILNLCGRVEQLNMEITIDQSSMFGAWIKRSMIRRKKAYLEELKDQLIKLSQSIVERYARGQNREGL